MDPKEFRNSLVEEQPPEGMAAPVAALWWDAKGDWQRAHSLVDELESREAMAVHAYLHRKEGSEGNADYWYARAGKDFYRKSLDEEWEVLVLALTTG
jgi:hypothetical protein